MPYKASYEEDGFLRQLGVRAEDAEALAENCSLVLVWHTQTYNSYRQAGQLISLQTLSTESYEFLDLNLTICLQGSRQTGQVTSWRYEYSSSLEKLITSNEQLVLYF